MEFAREEGTRQGSRLRCTRHTHKRLLEYVKEDELHMWSQTTCSLVACSLVVSENDEKELCCAHSDKDFVLRALH